MIRLLFLLLTFPALCLGQISGKVVGVHDGDTFTMLVGHTQLKVRLHGIDCPEKKQDYGTVAQKFASDKIFGKVVSVSISDTDRYGRLIGTVHLNGATLNEMLLRDGLAWHYCKYDKSERWHRIQDSAYKAGIGLWSMKAPIAPWEFRKRK